jgi:hypothetical protein
MKAKHHFWSSLATGGIVWWATGEASAMAGAMIGGFLIDADHALDQLWSIRSGAPMLRRGVKPQSDEAPGRPFGSYLRRRKLVRLPLLFHSYELLLALIIVALFVRSPLLVGLVAGYGLHLALDLIRHHHEFRSPMFYLFTYRLSNGFRRERLIKKEYI